MQLRTCSRGRTAQCAQAFPILGLQVLTWVPPMAGHPQGWSLAHTAARRWWRGTFCHLNFSALPLTSFHCRELRGEEGEEEKERGGEEE